MDRIPFYIKREELANMILKETDEDLLDRLASYFQEIKEENSSSYKDNNLFNSGRMTQDELRAEIMKSEKAFKEGLFIPHEEMRKKHPR